MHDEECICTNSKCIYIILTEVKILIRECIYTKWKCIYTKLTQLEKLIKECIYTKRWCICTKYTQEKRLDGGKKLDEEEPDAGRRWIRMKIKRIQEEDRKKEREADASTKLT
jgi:hypothetical protein